MQQDMIIGILNNLNELLVQVSSLEGDELKQVCRNLDQEMNIILDIVEMVKDRLGIWGGFEREAGGQRNQVTWGSSPEISEI